MSMGIVLPAGIVQPFDLRFAADDLHVMAFFGGHDEYEAVEAMILRSTDRIRFRAILTRHDQTQVDHVDDAYALCAARSLERETCLREVSIEDEIRPTSRRIIVRFDSFRGEPVVLDVESAGLPQARRGGLSDPGEHSAGSSLPLMCRGRSALASPASRVSIDGRNRPIPARIRSGDRVVAVEGYVTESHRMAALRAGTSSFEIVERPLRFEPGERWVYASADGPREFRIECIDRSGTLEIATANGAPQRITGRLVGGRLCLERLAVGDPRGPDGEASLAFVANDSFLIGVDNDPALVSGQVIASDDSILLAPGQPAWAVARPVTVRIASSGTRFTVTTRVGASPAKTPLLPYAFS